MAYVTRISLKFKESCSIPYPPLVETQVYPGIGEPMTFYLRDLDSGVPRGSWYKKASQPLNFNQPCDASESKSSVSKCIGLPGTRDISHLGCAVVHN